MKIFQYELSEWKSYGPNLYRIHRRPRYGNGDAPEFDLGIGLVASDATENCTWRPHVLDYTHKVYLVLYDLLSACDLENNRYLRHQLHLAKQDIDDFIIRVNKLKAFI